jgi:hypothetical protein
MKFAPIRPAHARNLSEPEEPARKTAPAVRSHRPEPVELRHVGVDRRGLAIHGAIRTDAQGRPVEIVECRGFKSRRRPNVDAIATQVADAVTAPIRQRLATLERLVANAGPALRQEPVEPKFAQPVPYWSMD